MSNRRDSIIKLIENYTQQQILNGSLDFGDCNAHNISVDLKIDRTNISRLLNQLHKEGKFIKINGRPTLYISMKVMANNFPYVSLPNIINKDDEINNYIHQASAAGPVVIGAKLDMVGSDINGSLYESILRILPILYYPYEEVKIITLRGEKGTGKKHFLAQFLKRGQEIGKFNRKQGIFYTDLDIIAVAPVFELKKLENSSYAIIAVAINNDTQINSMLSFINQISYYYRNSNTAQPVIALMIDSKVKEYLQYYDLTPYNSYFPPLSKRPLGETVELILSIIQNEADRLSQEVQISKDFIVALALENYTSNIFQLRNEIIYALSHSRFNYSGKTNTPLVLELHCLSDGILQKQNNKADIKDSLLAELPERIVLVPGLTVDLTKIIRENNVSKAKLIKDKRESKINMMEMLMTNLPTDLDNYSFSFHDLSFKYSISSIFEGTVLGKDPVLFEYVLSVVDQVVFKQIDINNYYFSKTSKGSKPAQSVYRKLMRFLDMNIGGIENEKKNFLKQVIFAAFDLVNQVQIPVIIITHGSELADNFALSFNKIQGRRVFYSLNYSIEQQKNEIDYFVKRISKYISTVSRGHGVLLVVDHDPLNKLDSKLFLKTRILTFSTYPASIVHINSVFELMNSGMSIVSFSAAIIRKKNNHKDYLADFTLNDKIVRNNDSNLKLMTELFPSMDIPRTNEILYRLLRQICDKISLRPNNQLIVDFLFHGNCVLERALQSDGKYFKQVSSMEDPDNELIEIIKEKISQSTELNTVGFSLNDYVIFYDCIHSALDI